MSSDLVERWYRNKDKPIESPKKRAAREKREARNRDFVRLYTENEALTAQMIARQFGVNACTVRAAIKDAGIKLTLRGAGNHRSTIARCVACGYPLEGEQIISVSKDNGLCDDCVLGIKAGTLPSGVWHTANELRAVIVTKVLRARIDSRQVAAVESRKREAMMALELADAA